MLSFNTQIVQVSSRDKCIFKKWNFNVIKVQTASIWYHSYRTLRMRSDRPDPSHSNQVHNHLINLQVKKELCVNLLHLFLCWEVQEWVVPSPLCSLLYNKRKKWRGVYQWIVALATHAVNLCKIHYQWMVYTLCPDMVTKIHLPTVLQTLSASQYN